MTNQEQDFATQKYHGTANSKATPCIHTYAIHFHVQCPGDHCITTSVNRIHPIYAAHTPGASTNLMPSVPAVINHQLHLETNKT